MKKTLAALAVFLAALPAGAQSGAQSAAQGTEQAPARKPAQPAAQQSPDEYADFGDDISGITVFGEQPDPNTVTREDMDRRGAADLWEALRDVPGVILSGGGQRNDSGIRVRGFGSESMPVFADGVTMANPYRGDNDAARMLTGDLEDITVQKGYSTLLLGPNTMGGAIITRTARPKAPFEASITSGFDFDILGKFAANNEVLSAGVKNPLWYGKTVFQYRGVDHFRIPDAFTPIRDNPQERGERLWSDSNDIKFTALAGWTPFGASAKSGVPGASNKPAKADALDISLSWVLQDSNKGFSPPDVNGKDYYIWEWPRYDRWSLIFNAAWKPDWGKLDVNAYFSKFDNEMIDYGSWANYEFGMHNPVSAYDDWTAGGRAQAAWNINGWNKLEAALNYRQDLHQGLTGGKLGVRVNEATWSAAAEWTTQPFKKWTFTAAAGLDAVTPFEFWGEQNEMSAELGGESISASKSKLLLAAQAGAFFAFTPQHELRVTYARKNHFPTMSQRYSTRFGESRPNPNLLPEYANHFELGWRGNFAAVLNASAAVYYSDIFYKIAEIRVPNPRYTAVTVSYTTNIDRTAMWGAETGFKFTPHPALSAGGSLSWNRYSIIKSWSGVSTLSYYPELTANLYAVISPVAVFSFIPSLQYVSSRYTGADGGEQLEAYFLCSLKAVFQFNTRLSASAACENLFDTLYEIRRYSPQPGRSYSVTFTARY
ncbi:MAG: TonB-dependent receptor [Spirochaetaceae bacterium]|jgi:iron complex outermembrane receptor protein|nr:TonB-dependent receptor [Spirochaetaceae bacterium]